MKMRDFAEATMCPKNSGRKARVALLLQALVLVSACSTRPADLTGPDKASDDAVAARVKLALLQDPYLYVEHINVTATRGVVRLSGVAAEADDFAKAIHIAKSVAGVKSVINDMQLVDRR
jgi:hypothetical protein